MNLITHTYIVQKPLIYKKSNHTSKQKVHTRFLLVKKSKSPDWSNIKRIKVVKYIHFTSFKSKKWSAQLKNKKNWKWKLAFSTIFQTKGFVTKCSLDLVLRKWSKKNLSFIFNSKNSSESGLIQYFWQKIWKVESFYSMKIKNVNCTFRK